MSNLVFYESKSLLDSRTALDGFIDYCRLLALYEDQGGFSVNTWKFSTKGRNVTMQFSRHTRKSNPYDFEPFNEPFLLFAKAYIRYHQSQKQVTSVADKLVALRVIHDALIEIHGIADILSIDGLVQLKVVELLNKWYPSASKLYQYGGQLENLYSFLIKKGVATALPTWKRPWKKTKERANRTDESSLKWREDRCPSMHQMLALADIFHKAEKVKDRYWSSILVLLMFAPGRGGELSELAVDSLIEDEGRLAVRWYGKKGFGHTIKWVPKEMESAVRESFSRLIEIGEPARRAAKFAYKNPGRFYRHDRCVTAESFAEDRPLNAFEFGHAMGFTTDTIGRMTSKLDDLNCTTAWNVLGAHQVKWIQKLRRKKNPTYADLGEYSNEKYQDNAWPFLTSTNRHVWDSLVLVRDNEFHDDFVPKGFSWVIPSVNQLNDQLSQRPMKNPIPTIFQRFGYKDEDGGEIELTSHQLRVWLSTNAERGGMDSWRLAKWAGRLRIKDNAAYDLRTQEEQENKYVRLMQLENPPTALEAVKLQLPVSYESLGLNRIGIADVTEYGMCVHDYAMSPCLKSGECMTCKEHVCVKGMPKTLERIKKLEEQVEFLLQKATYDETQEVFGANRWVTHFGVKLAHIRTQRKRLESEEVPEGAILWIPAEHDPSPIKRVLEQREEQSKLKTMALTHSESESEV